MGCRGRSELGKTDAKGPGLKSQPLLGSAWRSSDVRPPLGTSKGFCVPLSPSGLQTNITALVLAPEFWSSAWASILWFSSSQFEWLHIYEQTTTATPTLPQPSPKKWGHSLFLSIPTAPWGWNAHTGEINEHQSMTGGPNNCVHIHDRFSKMDIKTCTKGSRRLSRSHLDHLKRSNKTNPPDQRLPA